MNLHQWAAKWGVSGEAVADLMVAYGHEGTAALVGDNETPANETAVVQAIRVEAAQKGLRLFRNNNGATYDENGRFIRYGLANDSEAVNKRIKSADLVGIRPIIIGPHHVGHKIGQFVSRECKAPGWRFSNTPREQAQQRWAELVLSLGGDAAFATAVGSL